MGLCFPFKFKNNKFDDIETVDNNDEREKHEDVILNLKVPRKNSFRYNYNELTQVNVEYNNATFKNVPKYLPDIRYGKVVKVYDGDTITVVAQPYVDSSLYKFSIRLFGIDTPELRSKNENEKKAAIFVQKYLEDLIFNKFIIIDVLSQDKYGRILANIYLDNCDTDISSLLLSKKYGLPYNGGTKSIPENWLDIVNIEK